MSEPIHIISLGAGVQSSTMALMAAHGEITPMPKCAIFADTQDEPQSVYTWLDWLEKELPFPVHRVTAGRLSKVATNGSSGIPAFLRDGKGLLWRQCTTDFKVRPLNQKLRTFGDKVVAWIGISLDEVHRMKTAREAWKEFRYPLIEQRRNRNDCLLWMKHNGYPEPPRSACVFCPYHSDHEWRRLKRDEPKEFEIAVAFEKKFQQSKSVSMREIPFLHRSCLPLDQVDFSTDEDHGQQVMFGNECEGMCGV
jgi:hypothetical protein